MGRRDLRITAAAALGMLLLAACASPRQRGESPPETGAGTLHVTTWGEPEGGLTISGHAIAADGTLGAAREVVSGPAADTAYPGVVDGIGQWTLTADFTEYWTSRIYLRSGGTVSGELAAPRWCGGEGLTYTVCVLLDEGRLARTTELGFEAGSGEGSAQGSVLVASLADGATLAEFGPFAGLSMLYGTSSPNEVVVITSGAVDDPAASGTVLRLDLTDGTTTTLGVSPPNWASICPLGAAVVGFTTDSEPYQLVAVGDAEIADITLRQGDRAIGCSNDGRHLYVQQESGGVARITLADGQRAEALNLPPGQYAGPVTR